MDRADRAETEVRLRSMTRRTWGIGLLITAVLVVGGLAGWALLGNENGVKSVSTDEAVGVGTGSIRRATGTVTGSGISAADLEKVARTRVFFGHQSVGMNILDGVSGVFSAQRVRGPVVEQRRTAADTVGGFIVHAPIGENTKPLLKIQDFDAVIRGGMGGQVDVAVMKLCYIDIAPDTDVNAVFTTYRDTMAALEKDFPDVAFVKATVPLTTDPGTMSKLKQRLAGDGSGQAANVARERLNALIRKEYAGDFLFDLAAVESTAPDGTRVQGQSGKDVYYALYGGYASDNGHLNAEGSRRAATAWLMTIARVSSR